jgi:hypothetical protein
LDIESLDLILLETDIYLAGLAKNGEVGTWRKLGSIREINENSEPISVQQTGNKKVVLAIGETDDPDATITIEKITEDGETYYSLVMQPAELTTAPLVHGFPSFLELNLYQLKINPRTQFPPIVQGTATSVTTQTTGAEGGLSSGSLNTTF